MLLGSKVFAALIRMASRATRASTPHVRKFRSVRASSGGREPGGGLRKVLKRLGIAGTTQWIRRSTGRECGRMAAPKGTSAAQSQHSAASRLPWYRKRPQSAVQLAPTARRRFREIRECQNPSPSFRQKPSQLTVRRLSHYGIADRSPGSLWPVRRRKILTARQLACTLPAQRSPQHGGPRTLVGPPEVSASTRETLIRCGGSVDGDNFVGSPAGNGHFVSRHERIVVRSGPFRPRSAPRGVRADTTCPDAAVGRRVSRRAAGRDWPAHRPRRLAPCSSRARGSGPW